MDEADQSITGPTSKVIVSIGECMIELSSADEGVYRRGFAGDTFNTAWTLRAITDPSRVEVGYFTAVGEDHLSDELVNFIKASGIDASRISRVPSRSLGLYMIFLDGHERNFAYWREHSAARLLARDPEHLSRTLADVDVVYLSGITLAILDRRDRERLLSALAALRGNGTTIVFDGNIRPSLWPDATEMREALEKGYRSADIALPTFPDEAAVFGDTSPRACAERILDYGPLEVAVKNGPDPCLVAFGGEVLSIDAEAVPQPRDTTGAGDSFNAGYIAGRLVGMAPPLAAGFGHRVAGTVISNYGALVDQRILKKLVEQ